MTRTQTRMAGFFALLFLTLSASSLLAAVASGQPGTITLFQLLTYVSAVVFAGLSVTWALLWFLLGERGRD